MSRTQPTESEQFALDHIACAYCGVRSGSWCRTVRRFDGVLRPYTDQPHTTTLHGARTSPVVEVYRRAYRRGYADAAGAIASEITNNALGRWRLNSLERVVARCREMVEFWGGDDL
ncbi:hypothetical protein [Nocardioides sp. Leaf374]|uniref:hypothetical protein n=1 Tax=Nocardioides sp. Leaf374 TaxID=2876560 RepID=UPI001E379F63|nr:hypothetical protein [Nocardioides sp. Leaf374]